MQSHYANFTRRRCAVTNVNKLGLQSGQSAAISETAEFDLLGRQFVARDGTQMALGIESTRS